MSLARQHFQRVTAAQAAASASPGEPIKANAYELQLIRLADAKRALKQVQSIERKAEVKRRVLPEFEPWIRGALEAGRGGQDDVLMTAMVWRIDVGDFPDALDIAAYALKHKLTLPDQYKRDVATLVAEEIAEQSTAAIAAGKTADLASLDRALLLTSECDMPDEVRAKLHKALGQAFQVQVDGGDTGIPDQLAAKEALAHFKRALELHDRAGVKKDIERLERVIKPAPAT